MVSLVGVTTNTTTAKPTEMLLKCPFLTHSGYNSETNQHFCDYEPWAYGVFAIACLLLIMVPLVVIICCIVRTRNKNKRARRLRSNVTNNSYSSSEAPYQPLMQDRRQRYGAVEQDCGSSSIISPNDESVSERPSQQHDNTSTTSSKASLLPNYDQASLDFRNSTFNAPKNSESLANPVIPFASYNLGTDLIFPSRDVPSKTKSPIYAVLEEASPDERPNEGAKGLTVATDQEPVYSVLESPENNDSIIPENKHENVESNKQLPVPGNDDKEKKAFSENVNKCLDDLLNTIPEVKYAPNEEPNMLEPEPRDLVPSQKDVDNINNSPIYSILEPPLPEVPEQEQNPVIEENENLVKEKPEVNVQTDDKSDDDKLSAEDTAKETYIPPLPPRERPPGNAPDSGNYQALAPKLRLRLTSRTDYEEFLLDMIKSFPEAERNGTFVVRDSVTNPGSKALTVYNKSPNSEKDVFNFKVCFDDKGQAYLAKSTKRFPSLEQLLQHLRTDKDMLPCTLRNQLN